MLQALKDRSQLFFHPKVYFSKITLLSKTECRRILVDNFKIGTCLFLLLIIIFFIITLLNSSPSSADAPLGLFLSCIIFIGYIAANLFYYLLSAIIYLVLSHLYKSYQSKWNMALTISVHLSVSVWFYCLVPLFLLLQIVMFFYSIAGINSLRNIIQHKRPSA